MSFAALHFGCFWHKASFRCYAANGRFRGQSRHRIKRGAGANAGPGILLVTKRLRRLCEPVSLQQPKAVLVSFCAYQVLRRTANKEKRMRGARQVISAATQCVPFLAPSAGGTDTSRVSPPRAALSNSAATCCHVDLARTSFWQMAEQRPDIAERLERHHARNDQRPGQGTRPIARRTRWHSRLLFNGGGERGLPSASPNLAWSVGRVDYWRIHSCPMGRRLAFLLSAVAQHYRRVRRAVGRVQVELGAWPRPIV